MLNVIEIQLDPDESAAMTRILDEIEAENGAMDHSARPKHRGNFRFDFSRVPVAVIVGIAHDCGSTGPEWRLCKKIMLAVVSGSLSD